MDLNELKKDETVKKLFDEVHEEFKLPEGKEYDDTLNKRVELLACQLLIEHVEINGGTEKELHDILKYIAVIIDAEKYKLDWWKAYTDLGIDNLVEKYVTEGQSTPKEAE
jgi:hypothetical protein